MKPFRLFLGCAAATACGFYATLTVSQVVLPPLDTVAVVGAYNTVPPTLTNGQAGRLQVDANGNLLIAGTFSATGGTISNATDAQATTNTNQGSVSYNYGFNGATWDRLQVDASKFLKVNCSAGCSASGVVDEAAFTAGTSTFGPGGGFFQTTATANALTNGQQGMWQMTANRAGFVNLRNAAGTEIGTTAAPVNFNLQQMAGTAITAVPTAYGTAPTGNVPGFNVNVTNTNANGQATMANSSPVVIASNQSAVPASQSGTWIVQPGNTANTTPWLVNQANPYPSTATPYTATATGTTAATTATLAGAASVTTYLCGFSIRANATAAATGNATVTGVITATLNFTQWTAPNASGLGVTEMIFAPCIPASATNTSIAVVSAAPGTGGVVSVTAWGYKL